MRARSGALALFEEIRQSFIDQGLNLTAFFFRQYTNGNQGFGIDLSGEFSRVLTGMMASSLRLSRKIMKCQDGRF